MCAMTQRLSASHGRSWVNATQIRCSCCEHAQPHATSAIQNAPMWMSGVQALLISESVPAMLSGWRGRVRYRADCAPASARTHTRSAVAGWQQASVPPTRRTCCARVQSRAASAPAMRVLTTMPQRASFGSAQGSASRTRASCSPNARRAVGFAGHVAATTRPHAQSGRRPESAKPIQVP